MSECSVEPVVSVTLFGAVFGEEPVVIPPDCDGPGIWWNALSMPDWSMRYTYAPPSAWQHGQTMLGAVADNSTVPLVVAARGENLQDLQARMDALEVSLARWRYVFRISTPDTILLNVLAGPTLPRWGAVTPQRLGAYAAEAQIIVPVFPQTVPGISGGQPVPPA